MYSQNFSKINFMEHFLEAFNQVTSQVWKFFVSLHEPVKLLTWIKKQNQSCRLLKFYKNIFQNASWKAPPSWLRLSLCWICGNKTFFVQSKQVSWVNLLMLLAEHLGWLENVLSIVFNCDFSKLYCIASSA